MNDAQYPHAFPSGCRGVRGPLLHFLADPGHGEPAQASYEALDDGLLVIQGDRILAAGAAATLLPALPTGTPLEHWPDALIVPGFIDTHVHMPQLDVLASYGTQLLDWLETYTFPAEARFEKADWAHTQARLFVQLLLLHGTTSALAFSTSHKVSADALFEAAQDHHMAITTGKVMMDRHAPQGLRDDAVSGAHQCQALIDHWHGRGRQRYAVTPRFAATSSPKQLELAGLLLRDNPGVLMQTHWAENQAECAWIRELFPEHTSYLDVYRHYGLLTDHSVLAHGIHINDEDRRILAETGARIAFCPTSNLFLGSGLFDLANARRAGVNVGLATDVGGGTSLSMLVTMAEAYKVCQLRGQSLSPFQAFYMATLGNANVLQQADSVGNFVAGKYADFLVLDPASSPLLRLKQHQSQTLSARLFSLMTLGDDRAVRRTYVAGRCRYDRDDPAVGLNEQTMPN